MKKAILNLEGVTILTTQEEKQIKAGKTKDWDLCCLKEDSTVLPYGCEAWIICDGF